MTDEARIKLITPLLLNVGQVVYRVTPPHFGAVQCMDTRYPEEFSLKYKETLPYLRCPIFIETAEQRIQNELHLEEIRKNHFLHLPSRLTSIFVFVTQEEAERYQKSGWTEEGGKIDCFRILELYSAPFFSDMGVINAIGNLSSKWDEYKTKPWSFIRPTLEESLDEFCQLYWRGLGFDVPNSLREVLIQGKLEHLK